MREKLMVASMLCLVSACGGGSVGGAPSAGEGPFGVSEAAGLESGTADPILPEVKVTSAGIIDFEFDWGRDGSYCPTCNFGDGNNRFTFSDPKQHLWVAHVDPTTGDFVPANGAGTMVDTEAAIAKDFGNGPEWMFGSAGSQIVYTRYYPDLPQSPSTGSVAVAKMNAGVWSAGIVDDGKGKVSPMGTLDLTDPAPRMTYQAKGKVYWRVADDPSTEALVDLGGQRGGSGTRRWVDGTHLIILTAPAPGDPKGVHQVFTYDTDTSALTQLTFDPADKAATFMWRAPEFGGEYVFFTVFDATHIGIYRLLDSGAGPQWTQVNVVTMPPGAPGVWSPEPFVFKGHSYIFFEVTQTLDFKNPSQIAMIGIDPAAPLFQMLTNDTANSRVRSDPEYYITANGPYIYYNRYVTGGASKPPRYEGVYRVDTNLGPP